MQPVAEDVRALARELGAAVIDVPDTAGAVTDLAREWRAHLQGRVVALTGSTGKTTTKNLVRDVLAAAHTVVATVGNQNNELGVPKTLLAAEPETEAVVVEMGMRGAGQIAELCAFVRPDWGLVVNVGESHIELWAAARTSRAPRPSSCASCRRARARVRERDRRLRRASCATRRGSTRAACRTVLFDGSADAAARRVSADAAEQVRPAVWAERVELDRAGPPAFELHAVGFGGRSPSRTESRLRARSTLRGLHNVAQRLRRSGGGPCFGMPLAVCAEALAHAAARGGPSGGARTRAAGSPW